MFRRLLAVWMVFALLVGSAVLAQPGDTPWQAWETKTLASLGNDNTGAAFALSTEVLTPGGAQALRMMPGGASEENKLAFSVGGTDLAGWADSSYLALEVYLPEGNALNPNAFFMGMGDVTGSWKWIDGGFGKPEGDLIAGWNVIRYPITAAMKKPASAGKYILYLSFFHLDASQQKLLLSEPFYLGSAMLANPGTGGADRFANEAADLLKLDDAALIDAIARQTFDFFWNEANLQTGLIKDRSTPTSPASIAAVGFGLTAIPIGVDRGWITYEQGLDRALMTLRFFDTDMQGQDGFFYHWIEMATGKRAWESEVSSIDTALFIAGALSAGEYFRGTEVETLASQLYADIDWQAFAPNGKLISMGWKPETGYFRAKWDHFDESLLLYILAIGSPTHAVPPEAWNEIERPVNVKGEYIFLPSEPLFVYQYPLAWIDLRGKEDQYANYFNNTVRACERNRRYAQAHDKAFPTYRDGVWGISASDGPRGYKAYGATDFNHDGTVAPYASIACLPFTPAASFESIRAMLRLYGGQVWGEYGFVSAFNVDAAWYSQEHIGIDQGDMLLMIANYQDEFVWKLMAQNPYIQAALQKIGFVEQAGDYAVTPAFLKANSN